MGSELATARDIFKDPPLVEALCELFFHGTEWVSTIPGRFYDRIKDNYPQQKEISQVSSEISISEGGISTRVWPQPPVIRFLNPDGNRLVQVAKDLLVVNHLKPYTRFEDWEPTIYEMLGYYRDLAAPSGIQRLGLRYINRVSVPADGPTVKMEDYFTIYPQFPKGLGGEHGPFLLRLQAPAEGGHQVVITLGSAPRERDGVMTFLLDIYDLYAPEEPFPLDSLGGIVKTAHANAHRTFRESVTDRLKDLFGRKEDA